MKIKTFIFNEFQVNTYVLSDETRECLIIDPGCNDSLHKSELREYILSESLKPTMLVNTHGHIDHIAGNRFVHDAFGILPAIHEQDRFLLGLAQHFADLFGFTTELSPEPAKILNEGDEICFGKTVLKVFHIPGHSPGSIVLYSEEEKMVIAGDVLFSGSVGRTDLPGGDHYTLIRGIREKLMTLPRETVVYPGHGPSTTIGEEYDTNPFLRCV
ncbi:MAG: MBL fold metallo-hydrolase [Bacteroidales bacterium]|nr:MBL fold metallo-hydrolase [Bacteroidales bacterium]MBN2762435.1 MBL fold metallo-hydrolase [Bacteroidales bacterium]